MNPPQADGGTAYWTKHEAPVELYLSGFSPGDESSLCTRSYFEADAYSNWGRRTLADRVRMGTAAFDCRSREFSTMKFSSTRIVQFGNIRGSQCLAMFGNGHAALLALSRFIGPRGRTRRYNGNLCATSTCCAAVPAHVAQPYRRTYRNFFQPEKRCIIQDQAGHAIHNE